MKRFFIFCLFSLFFCFSVSAQTVTINTLPKNQKGVRMNFQMDFSEAVMFGMSENEFAEYEKDWNKDKPTIINNCRKSANLTVGKSCAIGNYKNALYTINVIVKTITDEGFIICDVDIVNGDGEVVFHIDDLTGGKEPSVSVGSKLARIKFWSALIGKNLGSILKLELKK